MPPWAFCTEAGTPLDKSKVRKVFSRVLKRANLLSLLAPTACGTRSRAYSFSRARAQSTSSGSSAMPASSSRWIRAVGDYRWETRRQSIVWTEKVVAKTMGATEGPRQGPEKNGEPWWDRTTDPLLKRQVLYLLS